MSTPAIELRAGALRLALRPDLGGSIAGLWCDDLPVLRSTEGAALERARLAGCYPLIPYANRLGHRRFRWLGQDYTTAPNFDDSPHSVHGMGWLRAWTVESQREHDAVLALHHAGDADWPFAFRARQAFALSGQALNIGLSIVNEAPHPAPVGLGWHPYFQRRTRSRLHVELTDRWVADPTTQLPTRKLPQPGIDGDVAHLDFDNCFEGWPGSARLRDEKLSIRLTSSLPYLVVYTPRTRPYYCVEPVSHVGNAIHMSDPAAHGLRTLQPGEHAEAWMKIDVARV